MHNTERFRNVIINMNKTSFKQIIHRLEEILYRKTKYFSLLGYGEPRFRNFFCENFATEYLKCVLRRA